MKIAKIENFGKIIVESGWERARAATIWTKEPETIAWIDSFDDNGVFWDIGANIGIYSLYCAKKHQNMQIQAFEPMRNNFLRLWQNIFLNNYVNVEARCIAFGRCCETVFFNCGNEEIGSSGGQVNDLTGYQVMVFTGEAIAHDYWRSPGKSPNYIKIDTDGNEWDILLGMEGLFFDGTLQSVLVEVNNHEYDIIEFMENYGYVLDSELMARKDRESDHNMIFTLK
jgi:FkbM family methyltransferase